MNLRWPRRKKVTSRSTPSRSNYSNTYVIWKCFECTTWKNLRWCRCFGFIGKGPVIILIVSNRKEVYSDEICKSPSQTNWNINVWIGRDISLVEQSKITNFCRFVSEDCISIDHSKSMCRVASGNNELYGESCFRAPGGTCPHILLDVRCKSNGEDSC